MKLFGTSDDTTAEDETAQDETAQDENGATAMSQDTTQTADERPATTHLASDEPATARDTSYAEPGTTTDQDAGTTSDTDDASYATGATVPAYETPADETPAARPVDEPAAVLTADTHLIANTAGMKASWQQVQAEFVDDPQAAVMGAADLIEQTAQSLVDGLKQRQQALRGAVSGRDSDTVTASAVPDTEHLRQMMQRYRTLFDQLCNA